MTEYKTYGDKVMSDLWGPAKVTSLGGNKYANTYMDAHTCEERAYYLPSKSNTFTAYKKYEAWVRVQCGAPIKIFGCDRGGEFMSHEFMEHLENQAQFVTSLCMINLLQMAWWNGQIRPSLKGHVLCFTHLDSLNTYGQKHTTTLFGCETAHQLMPFQNIRPHMKWQRAKSLTFCSFRNSA